MVAFNIWGIEFHWSKIWIKSFYEKITFSVILNLCAYQKWLSSFQVNLSAGQLLSSLWVCSNVSYYMLSWCSKVYQCICSVMTGKTDPADETWSWNQGKRLLAGIVGSFTSFHCSKEGKLWKYMKLKLTFFWVFFHIIGKKQILDFDMDCQTFCNMWMVNLFGM